MMVLLFQIIKYLFALHNVALFQMKIWSSHLLDNFKQLSHEPEKFSGDSTGFEPMTSAMPVKWSNQLSYKVTQLRAGQFVGLMFSRERNVVWKKCYMKCRVWNQMKIWSSHLLDNFKQLSHDCTGIAEVMGSNPVESPENFSGSWDNCLKLSSKCEDHIFIWFQTTHFI